MKVSYRQSRRHFITKFSKAMVVHRCLTDFWQSLTFLFVYILILPFVDKRRASVFTFAIVGPLHKITFTLANIKVMPSEKAAVKVEDETTRAPPRPHAKHRRDGPLPPWRGLSFVRLLPRHARGSLLRRTHSRKKPIISFFHSLHSFLSRLPSRACFHSETPIYYHVESNY